MKECLNCNKDLKQIPGKRQKSFCNSTCRSNYWQKANRLKSNSKAVKPEPKQVEENKIQEPVQVLKNTNDRLPGETSLDYKIRISGF